MEKTTRLAAAAMVTVNNVTRIVSIRFLLPATKTRNGRTVSTSRGISNCCGHHWKKEIEDGKATKGKWQKGYQEKEQRGKFDQKT